MNINVISHNLIAMNAQRTLGVSTKSKTRSMEKLSSGYRINRSSDDASGLAVSEKMRRLIRGLNQGTENAQYGVSWVQIGDGSLEESHEMLHRMTELTVKALNETNTDTDRAMMQMEFEQLQSEIDRLTDASVFNEKHIFSEHQYPYYQLEGNVKWLPRQSHVITDGLNNLNITYKLTDNSPAQTAAITVPAGKYTTQELIDEIDTALEDAGLRDQGFIFEYTDFGTCNLNLEGGTSIDSVSGGLAYLLYDIYAGGSPGALIGTTTFTSDTAKLPISTGNNDYISFTIESLNGQTVTKELTIPAGNYTRSELIDWLNNNLQDTTVKAVEYGSSIKLVSDDSIITDLKGNMFKIDDPAKGESIFTSVFYDNVDYGTVTMTYGTFTGGAVLPTNSKDSEHKYFQIDDTNNELRLQPNGSDTSVTLVIDAGQYTAAQMASKLNELFAANGLELSATVYSSSVSNAGTFQGLKITSNIKGLDSAVGIDASSSAYDTLFVTRSYNAYKTDAVSYYDRTSDKNASFTGGKSFSGSNIPLTITQDVNDRFLLNVDGSQYTVQIAQGVYNNAADIASAINNAIAALPNVIGVTATVSANKIRLTEGVGSNGIQSIKASAASSNNGYIDIFTRGITYTPATQSGTGSVTLNTAIGDPVTIDGSNNKLTVNLDGVSYEVTLPTGSLSHQDIINAVNDQLQAGTTTMNVTFQDVSASGTTVDNTFSSTGSGSTSAANASYMSVGSSDNQQGQVGSYTNSVPAQVTIDKALPTTTQITSANNQLQLTVNNITKSITLDSGSYSRAAFVNMLQTKLNEAYGTAYGGVEASLDSGKLVLTARLTYADGTVADGKTTSINCNTSTSSFLKDLNTTKTPAVMTLNKTLQSSITLDGTNNDFNFSLTQNGVEKEISLALSQGTYTRSSLIAEINKKLAAANIGVTASLYNNSYLRLTTTDTGSGYKLSYSTDTGGSSVDALFGTVSETTPAQAVANQDIQDTITIDANSNQFCMTVNGTPYTLTLDSGSYTRQGFVDQLNKKFQAAGAGITAALVGSKIQYTTVAEGRNASFSISYSGGGSAMKAIYGETTVSHQGVTAEFTNDNKLKLTTTTGSGRLSVSSSGGGIFQKPSQTVTTNPATSITGYHSTNHAYIDGVNITEPVTIDQWNNDLKFYFYDNSSSAKTISITLAEKQYTFSELQNALQDKLDAAAGSGKLKASVTSDGVRIEAVNTGYSNRMTSFSGNFYYKVLCSTTEQKVATKPVTVDGSQTNDPAFTVGRKDIRNNTTEITAGVNDSLSLDFTYGGVVHKLSMTLSAGKYNGQGLTAQIQEKLNEQLVALGLEENTIKATVGGVSTNVYGSNDDDALVFQLSGDVKLPAEGEYIIDGVGGTAAFSVFYQTDGDIKAAYVKGTKDVSNGVTIPKESEFAFDTDGVNYTVQIPAGSYSADELIEQLNKQLKDAGAPVVAELSGQNVKLSYTKYGQHEITNITGDARKYLFFEENGQKSGEDSILIQIGSESGDWVEIERPALNTCFLGINSVVISKPKYAEKALMRLKEAVTLVSNVRTLFGTMQNRLEHTIRKNENTSENTQAAESVIRDTDVSKEMLALSTANILEQVGVSLIAQANQSREDLLALLQ